MHSLVALLIAVSVLAAALADTNGETSISITDDGHLQFQDTSSTVTLKEIVATLGILQTNLNNTQQVLKDVQQELATTKQALNNTQQVLNNTQQELATTKQALNNTQQGMATTLQELNNTQQALTNTQQALNTTQQGLATTQQEMATTRQELSTTKQEFATMKQELNSTQQALVNMQQGLATTQQELATTQQELATTKQALENTQQTLTWNEQNISAVQLSLAGTSDALAHTQLNLSDARQLIDDTRADLSETTTNLTETRAELQLQSGSKKLVVGGVIADTPNASTAYLGGSYPQPCYSYLVLATGDVNGDGHMDLVAALRQNGSIVWYRNSGNGTSFQSGGIIFQPQLACPTDKIQVADINNDTYGDILIVSYSCKTALVLKSSGGVSFTGMTTLLPNEIEDALLVDINNDGLVDVGYLKNSTLLGRINLGNFAFASQITLLYGTAGGNGMFVTDMNGDGYDDISQRYSLLLNNKNMTFHYPQYSGCQSGITVAIVDMDGDGVIDTLCRGYWIKNTLVGTVMSSTSEPLPTFNHFAIPMDVDGDGQMDIVTDSLFIQLLPQRFTHYVLFSYSGYGNYYDTMRLEPTVGDMDGNGLKDVVWLDGLCRIVYSKVVPNFA